MSVHLKKAIENLKKRLLELGSAVEETVFQAGKSVDTLDVKLAEKVIEGDSKIDLMEVEVEEECLKLLALHQPVAIDLRFIVSVFKMNNDLERIGDLAVNIAQRARALASLKSEAHSQVDFQDVQFKVQGMLRNALQSLVELDPDMALKVCMSDRAVDDINRDVHKQVIDKIRKFPQDLERLILYLSVSRNLERIADHATNIAEDVLYMVRGEIVRHKKEIFTSE